MEPRRRHAKWRWLNALQRHHNRLTRQAGRPDQQRWTTLVNRHMAFDAIGELFRDTLLRPVVSRCFGTDPLIWQTTFFLKYARSERASGTMTGSPTPSTSTTPAIISPSSSR